MELIGLDFETYASTDLLKHGLHRYVHCTDFTPLLAAVAWKGGAESVVLDFVEDYEHEADRLVMALDGKTIVAHNAGFEQSVLGRMGIHIPSERFIDSAVLARAAGAAGKLEVAAPQLLGNDKLATGIELIKLFSIPGKYQEAAETTMFQPAVTADHPDEWAQFAHYCAVDAQLSLQLACLLLPQVSEEELANNAVTMDMNNVGWNVDLDAVREMQRRYQANVEAVIFDFRRFTNSPDLNLNSTPQMIEWCGKRGVRAKSFDEVHVEKLLTALNRKLAGTLPFDKAANYAEVIHLLLAKQAMGGSSLKKLEVILNTTGGDDRLHDQYLHIGAGATYRTTGRGVQMQNLKRLNGEGDDMAELWDASAIWTNGRLASNLRQVFTATHPMGALVVGDFASVESRGLAWQAGEQWKLDSYAKGNDLYKVQAGMMFNIPPVAVTKDQRQVGKVGELACGYGAGPDAVREFAKKMGVDLSEGESTKLVKDWRGANPRIVDYWSRLDAALHRIVTEGFTSAVVRLPQGSVQIIRHSAPQSLCKQTGDSYLQSLAIFLYLTDGTPVLHRVIHGVHPEGRGIGYWKPTERKTGDLWVDYFTNPKTKRAQKHTLYGGKLAGLLTQSLCREVFFTSLREIHEWVQTAPNVELVGQFHDEVVLDWAPDPQHGASLQWTKDRLHQYMTSTILPGFPLAAEIKHDYRYTK